MGHDQTLLPLSHLRVDGQMSSLARPKWGPDNLLQNFSMLVSSSNLVSHLGRRKKKSLGHSVLIYITLTCTTSVILSQLYITEMWTIKPTVFGDTEITVIFHIEIAVIFHIWFVSKRTLHLVVIYLTPLDASHQAECA